ncbi:Uncharacterised protein [Nocardia otitidiscaviarum]|uniref:Uncharacterized protein n=1 Tax=Nocardia otitidiscaviarum TaxID=1823 RepID=A0A379JLM7_9NOCA|nr:hypothetical protein [Nocardia otitidiscaviarum]SUD49569.1 Uncharacterised protein [Nocardia otitidiscaviarum]
MTTRAYGIVRTDLAGSAGPHHVEALRAFARQGGVDLRGICAVVGDHDFALLLETLEASGISTLIVPTTEHLVGGWADRFRAVVDVQTICPCELLRRHSASDATIQE